MEMKTIDAKQCTTIAMGRLGENDYTLIRFDVSAWLEELPGAVIGLYNQRPGDAAAYPVAEITVDGGIATWTVTSAELTKTGEGRCELVAITGEVVAKSAIFRTMVFDALDGSGEAPEPWEEWQQQLIILKNEAEQAADRAEEAVEHYPRIVDGVWEVWDAQEGAFVSTGVQAQGPQGIQGVPGPQGEPGAQGEPGDNGVTFTPAVSAEGVISWTNDGGLPNPQSQNIKGPVGATPNLTIGTVETLEPGADATAEITGTPESPVLNLGIPQGEQGEDADISNLAPIIVNSASGDIASFADGADGLPLKSCIVNIKPVQDLHGYDSPWPGGGGVNLLPADYTERITLAKTFLFDTPLPAGQYTFSFISADTSSQVASYQLGRYRDKTGSYEYTAISPTQGFATFTNTEPCSKVILYSNKAYNESNGFTTVFTGLMVKAGGTGTYSPYSNICPITGWTGAKVTVNEDVLDITFPTEAGTVYSGTLDVTNGVLTVDRAIINLSSNISWSTWGVNYKTSGITGFYIYRHNMPSTLDFSNIGKAVLTNLLSVKDIVWGGSAVGYLTNARGDPSSDWYEIVSIDNGVASISSTDTNEEAVEKFKAFLATTPLNVLYELATPIAYTLTPQEIRTLLGTNNIWADTGNTSVIYKADTKLYIDKKFAELQALILEN